MRRLSLVPGCRPTSRFATSASQAGVSGSAEGDEHSVAFSAYHARRPAAVTQSPCGHSCRAVARSKSGHGLGPKSFQAGRQRPHSVMVRRAGLTAMILMLAVDQRRFGRHGHHQDGQLRLHAQSTVREAGQLGQVEERFDQDPHGHAERHMVVDRCNGGRKRHVECRDTDAGRDVSLLLLNTPDVDEGASSRFR